MSLTKPAPPWLLQTAIYRLSFEFKKTVKIELIDFNKMALMNDTSKENLFESPKKGYNNWQQKITIENPSCWSEITGSD